MRTPSVSAPASRTPASRTSPTGLALALNRTATGRFLLIRLYLVLRWRLPWNVMAFLDDAHRRRGVLRQVGSVYQFRHIDIQRRLAAPDTTPPDSPTPSAPPPSTDPL
ncbi:hypothetical protein PV963_40150 [Streptomyces coeruleorubidus]|uniref:hypothetical protein n=1 Tax=Streptomyces coeruleorubidus TaxID=116188 RepID=UPI00237FC0E9|nr:hypothetical protein [Streptomyces coeruleorubidus]WDV56115.1 hypothetical protein PV963_40150 [Streptomyces coeruleorubidus]